MRKRWADVEGEEWVGRRRRPKRRKRRPFLAQPCQHPGCFGLCAPTPLARYCSGRCRTAEWRRRQGLRAVAIGPLVVAERPSPEVGSVVPVAQLDTLRSVYSSWHESEQRARATGSLSPEFYLHRGDALWPVVGELLGTVSA